MIDRIELPVDSYTRKERSRIMATVRSRNNKSTELRLRSALISSKIRGWRCQGAGLPGTPDFVFPKHKLAVFVDGCFWHGCSRCYRRPKSNRRYWDAKLKKNVRRDRVKRRQLSALGWRVMHFWEHQVLSSTSACVAAIRWSMK